MVYGIGLSLNFGYKLRTRLGEPMGGAYEGIYTGFRGGPSRNRLEL